MCALRLPSSPSLTSVPASHLPPPSSADLNAYLLQMEENIAKFAAQLGCAQVEQEFRRLAADRCEELTQNMLEL